jgi:hypothetical protein
MAQKNVVVCDMFAGVYRELFAVSPVGFRQPMCDRLASYACPICHRDVCTDHRAFGLSVTLANTSPPENPQSRPQKPLLPCVNDVLTVAICIECHLLYTAIKQRGGAKPFGTGDTAIEYPKISTVPHMQTLLDAIYVELGAARATITLTDP